MAYTGSSQHEYGSSHHSSASANGIGMDMEMEITSDYDPSTTSSGFTSIETTTDYYTYENGRRYQNLIHGRYPLPNDETEQTREGYKHHIASELLDGRLAMAPIGDHPQNIIDLGSGCGLWATEAAETFPSAHVTAIDLSPIGPYLHPPNVEWRLDDIEADWPATYAHTDFIHARAVIQTVRNPNKLIRSAYQHLKPGGWVEFEDFIPRVHCDDNTLPSQNALRDFFRLFESHFAEHYHWDLRFPERLPAALQAAGFVRVSSRREKVPIGKWSRDKKMKRIGLYMQPVLECLILNVLAKRREMDLSVEEVQTLIEETSRVIKDPTIHAYIYWHSVWAQKPAS